MCKQDIRISDYVQTIGFNIKWRTTACNLNKKDIANINKLLTLYSKTWSELIETTMDQAMEEYASTRKVPSKIEILKAAKKAGFKLWRG